MVTVRSSGRALTWLVLNRAGSLCERREGRMELDGKQLGLDILEDVEEAKAPGSARSLPSHPQSSWTTLKVTAKPLRHRPSELLSRPVFLSAAFLPNLEPVQAPSSGSFQSSAI